MICEKLMELLGQSSFFNVSGGCGYDLSHGKSPCMGGCGLWFKYCPFCGKRIKSKFTGERWIWWEEKEAIEMNIKEIIRKYLRDNGFDGLFNDYAECGCKIDDLVPCDCVNINDCEPGYLRSATDEFKWSIGPKESQDG